MTSDAAVFPDCRPRRLRATAELRRLVSQTRLHRASLIQPLFVAEGITRPRPVDSMPGVFQHTLDTLGQEVRRAAEAGIGGVMLFGVPAVRDAIGSGADDPDGILNRGIAVAVTEAGRDLVVMSDVCLDEFTDHGHCGVLAADGSVDNDATLLRYADVAVARAVAGARIVGLSGMMDGQVAAVRAALDSRGFSDVAILAYAAKFASAWYGPFRDAVESQLTGDRRAYQQDPGNRREALREAALDIGEGADILMVKPALGYLDVVADVSARSPVPVWAYQVSGEYAAVEAGAANGWLDREALMFESVLSIRRAGAEAILTYWATELAGRLPD